MLHNKLWCNFQAAEKLIRCIYIIQGNCMTYETLELNREGSTLFVRLNRPQVHNAMNDIMLKELTECFADSSENQDVRAVVLTGNGKSFSAGADLNWMKSMIDYSFDENVKDSRLLLELYDSMYNFPKPLIARVNGHAFGGGVGLMAVCDVVIAVPDAKFAFSEINLGIIPSVISSFVVKRIGISHMRRLFITGERFDSIYGYEIGLVDHVVPEEDMDDEVEKYLKILRSSAPEGVKEVKELLNKYQEMTEDEYKEYTVKKISELRVSPEGQEGIGAFLEKRKSKWSDTDV